MVNHKHDTIRQCLRAASAAQLERATADNHAELFRLNAVSLGGEIKESEGLNYSFAPPNNGHVAFPSEATGDQLSEMMDFFKTRNVSNIGCWSLDTPASTVLGSRLLARGFQRGWRPCWMAADLETLKREAGEITPGFFIRADNEIEVTRIKDLPYNDDNGAISGALFRRYPNRVQRFVAFLDGVIIAHCCLFFSSGPGAVAGIYNVGVLPSQRGKGFGKKVVLAACGFAKKAGYQYVTLNANDMGRPLYERVGFRFISSGLTWWIVNNRYITHTSSEKIIQLTEAVAIGDINALSKWEGQFVADDINSPLTNRMTLLQLAVECRQPAAAEWLFQQGAGCTALDAWDLGWKDRAVKLLQANPDEVNRRYDDWEGTLLHIAAERDDTDLARIALEQGADPTIKDGRQHGTAMDWACFFKRQEIIALYAR